ncbi:unnamed protein product, partial [Effrenium voratum]
QQNTGACPWPADFRLMDLVQGAGAEGAEAAVAAATRASERAAKLAHERAPTLGPPALGAPRSDLSDRGSVASGSRHEAQAPGAHALVPAKWRSDLSEKGSASTGSRQSNSTCEISRLAKFQLPTERFARRSAAESPSHSKCSAEGSTWCTPSSRWPPAPNLLPPLPPMSPELRAWIQALEAAQGQSGYLSKTSPEESTTVELAQLRKEVALLTKERDGAREEVRRLSDLGQRQKEELHEQQQHLKDREASWDKQVQLLTLERDELTKECHRLEARAKQLEEAERAQAQRLEIEQPAAPMRDRLSTEEAAKLRVDLRDGVRLMKSVKHANTFVNALSEARQSP